MNDNHSPINQCHICSQAILKNSLKKHYFEEHRKVLCRVCHTTFESEEEALVHMNETHKSSVDPCHICGKHVKRSSMANHVKMVHHSEDMRKHLCNICGNAYKTKTDLDRHYTKHTGNY